MDVTAHGFCDEKVVWDGLSVCLLVLQGDGSDESMNSRVLPWFLEATLPFPIA